MSSEKFLILTDDNDRYEFENGVVFIYRQPTTREIVNYKNSIKFRRKGKDFTSQSAHQQLALAMEILINVEGAGYRDREGEAKTLDRTTVPEEIAHIQVEGRSPGTWKELLAMRRPLMMFQFIEEVLAGLEEIEKN
jgi:hypothetical protein